MSYVITLGQRVYRFGELRDLLAKASPAGSGDALTAIAASTEDERMTSRMALVDLTLRGFLDKAVVPYASYEVTRLIMDSGLATALAPTPHFTVDYFRELLTSEPAGSLAISLIAAGLAPETVAGVSKLMRNQDLIAVAKKYPVISTFHTTIGLPGRLSVRLQPNHSTDNVQGVAASMLDRLIYGCGDAVIGINPTADGLPTLQCLLHLRDDFCQRNDVPMQSCVLSHITRTICAVEQSAPVDRMFQPIAGTKQANASVGVSLAPLREEHEADRSLARGTVEIILMYFKTGQGSALSTNAHGIDQQTLEAHAYAVARAFDPLLVNAVVGFIAPEYLNDGKQSIYADLKDHFCGRMLGVPMGCDICYANHAEADQDDRNPLLTVLAAAGVNFIAGLPDTDDIMLNYRSPLFHDALYVHELFGLRREPEFEASMASSSIVDDDGALALAGPRLSITLAQGGAP